jgi:hypothetical protein
MPVYQKADRPRPDSDFEPGTLAQLVPGVRGRLLDPRRTPVSVVEVRPATGFVLIRVEGFEDAGAVWEIPLEDVGHFQFEADGPCATDPDVAEMRAAIERFSGVHVIEAGEEDRLRTEARIAECQPAAERWLRRSSRFLVEGRTLPDPATRRGDPHLTGDLEAWLREQGLWDIESTFARTFVSNPRSGEVVKGHRIVLAELGMAEFAGSIVRDPATFEGPWSRARREAHIVARIAFVRALFECLGRSAVTLWRGASFAGRLEARPGRTFVSTSFDTAVARSHFEDGAADWTHVLVRQDVPVGRVFMTYLETAAMNGVFLEAEAVVLARPHDGWP